MMAVPVFAISDEEYCKKVTEWYSVVYAEKLNGCTFLDGMKVADKIDKDPNGLVHKVVKSVYIDLDDLTLSVNDLEVVIYKDCIRIRKEKKK
jgi:hypothetical protein